MDREPLTDAYLAECEQRARRFSGCWDAGISGQLAADVMRMIFEVRRLKVEAAYRENIRRPMPALGYVAD